LPFRCTHIHLCGGRLARGLREAHSAGGETAGSIGRLTGPAQETGGAVSAGLRSGPEHKGFAP